MKEVKLGRCKSENAKVLEHYGNKLLVCDGERIAKISSKGYLYIDYEKLNKKNAVYLDKFWNSYKDEVYSGRNKNDIFAAKWILNSPEFYENKRFDLRSGFWRRFK